MPIEESTTKLRILIFGCFSFVISRLLEHTATWPIAYWVTTFPGTFLHESMHYMFAYLMNGNPTGFSVFPTWGKGGMETLGHVLFAPNWYNSAAVSLAPLMLVPMSLFFVWKAAKSLSWKWAAWWSYLSSCAWLACLPSGQDWSNAIAGPISLVLLVIIVSVSAVIIFKIWRLRRVR